MRQTRNAVKFLIAEYRAIFRQAYKTGLATVVAVGASSLLASFSAQASTQVLEGDQVTITQNVDSTEGEDGAPQDSPEARDPIDITNIAAGETVEVDTTIEEAVESSNIEGTLNIKVDEAAESGVDVKIKNSITLGEGGSLNVIGLDTDKMATITGGENAESLTATLDANGGTINVSNGRIKVKTVTASGGTTINLGTDAPVAPELELQAASSDSATSTITAAGEEGKDAISLTDATLNMKNGAGLIASTGNISLSGGELNFDNAVEPETEGALGPMIDAKAGTINLNDVTAKVTAKTSATLQGTGMVQSGGSFTNDGTLVITGGDSVAKYDLKEGASFTNNGSLDLQSGHMAIGGDFINEKSGTIVLADTTSSSSLGKASYSVTKGVSLSETGTLTNKGTFDLSVINNFKGAGTITNDKDATFKLGTDADLSGTVDNAGTFEAGAKANLTGTINNSGTFKIAVAGDLDEYEANLVSIKNATFAGTFNNNKDAILTVGEKATISGKLNNDGTASFADAEVTGTITNNKDATLNLDGTADIKGTINNAGELNLGKGESGSTLTGSLNNTGKTVVSGSGLIVSGGSLINSGTLDLQSALTYSGGSHVLGGELAGSGNVVLSGATLQIKGEDFSNFFAATAEEGDARSGKLKFSGDSTLDLGNTDLDFEKSGILSEGALNSGVVEVEDNKTATFTNIGTATFGDKLSGSLVVSAQNITAGNAFSVESNLTFSKDFNFAAADQGLKAGGGTVTVSGASGVLTFNGTEGTINGNVTLGTAGGGGAYSALVNASNPALKVEQGTLTVTGDVALNDGGITIGNGKSQAHLKIDGNLTSAASKDVTFHNLSHLTVKASSLINAKDTTHASVVGSAQDKWEKATGFSGSLSATGNIDALLTLTGLNDKLTVEDIKEILTDLGIKDGTASALRLDTSNLTLTEVSGEVSLDSESEDGNAIDTDLAGNTNYYDNSVGTTEGGDTKYNNSLSIGAIKVTGEGNDTFNTSEKLVLSNAGKNNNNFVSDRDGKVGSINATGNGKSVFLYGDGNVKNVTSSGSISIAAKSDSEVANVGFDNLVAKTNINLSGISTNSFNSISGTNANVVDSNIKGDTITLTGSDENPAGVFTDSSVEVNTITATGKDISFAMSAEAQNGSNLKVSNATAANLNLTNDSVQTLGADLTKVTGAVNITNSNTGSITAKLDEVTGKIEVTNTGTGGITATFGTLGGDLTVENAGSALSRAASNVTVDVKVLKGALTTKPSSGRSVVTVQSFSNTPNGLSAQFRSAAAGSNTETLAKTITIGSNTGVAYGYETSTDGQAAVNNILNGTVSAKARSAAPTAVFVTNKAFAINKTSGSIVVGNASATSGGIVLADGAAIAFSADAILSAGDTGSVITGEVSGSLVTTSGEYTIYVEGTNASIEKLFKNNNSSGKIFANDEEAKSKIVNTSDLTGGSNGGGDNGNGGDGSNPSNPSFDAAYRALVQGRVSGPIFDLMYPVLRDLDNPAIAAQYIASEVGTGKSPESIETTARLANFAGVSQSALAAQSALTDTIAARAGIGVGSMNLTSAQNAMGGSLWVSPLYKSVDASGFGAQGVNYGADITLSGLALGADYTLKSGLMFGGAFNVGSGDSDGTGTGSSASSDFDYYGFAFYGGYSANNFTVLADLSYSRLSSDFTQSTVRFNELDSSADSSIFSLGVTGKYDISISDSFIVSPHVGLRYTSLDHDNYDINSKYGVFAHTSMSKQNIVSIPFGVTLQGAFTSGTGADTWTIKPSLDITLTANTGDTDLDSTTDFFDVGVVDLTAETLDSFTYGTTLGIEAQSGNFGFGAGLNYTGSSNVNEFGVSANVKIMF